MKRKEVSLTQTYREAMTQIRAYEDTDTGELLAAVRESVQDLWPWMPFGGASYSAGDAAAWIRASREALALGTMYDFAVIDDQGRYCGGCGINQINKLHRFANVGYWVRSSRMGQGIAVEAVQAVVAWAFANTTLNRLEAVVATGNVRSHRVALKAGAVLDGGLRQRVVVDGQASDAALYSFVRPG